MSLVYGVSGFVAGAALGLAVGILLAIPMAADVRDPRALIVGCTLALAVAGTLGGWMLARRG